MPITAPQRAWLKDLGNLVGGSTGVEPDEDERGEGGAPKLRRVDKKALAGLPVLDDNGGGKGGQQRLGFGPEDILPVIPDIIDGLTDRRATVAIHNNTQQVLKLDTASLDEIDDESGKTPGIVHGTYVVFPQSQVNAGDQSGRFVAENNKVGPLSTTGAEGVVKYILDPQGTAWFVHFNNPFGVAGEGSDNSADARVEGPSAANFETPKPGMSGTNDVKYLFILNAKGGTGPVPPVPPVPPPATDVPSSCQITITNQTQHPLSLSDQGHDRGDFMTLVPTSVPPGGTITVVSVETPNAKEEGCKGFIVWEVGAPMVAAWRVEWDNPEGAKNTTDASLTPQTAGFKSIDQIGQGEENVPVQFVLSGGGPGGEPVVPPEPKPEPAFEPPVESKQPTLRKGDKTQDGWIEYAQSLLNFHQNGNLAVDGNFDSTMHSAVLKFQKDKGLQVDGVIGNQTWAALREGAPEKPSTDGRQPHTFVEKGVEARWTFESPTANRYFPDIDLFGLAVAAVGDQPVDASTEATIRISPPGGKARTVKVKLGPGEPQPSGEGAVHNVRLENFRKNFPSVPADAPVNAYLVEAYLPQELGGDFYSGHIKEQGK